MDVVVNRMLTPADPTKRVVLAYGNGAFSGSAKGSAPGPVRSIKDHIMRKHGEIFVIIDEFNTSKTCSRCLQGPLAGVRCHNSRGRTESIWGLKRCTSCRELRSRDRNAAENMAILLAARREGLGERPGFLARPVAAA